MKNGATPAFSFPVVDEDFVKSNYSTTGSAQRCVAVARKIEGVAIRDTKDPDKTTLFFNPQEWDAFLKGAKEGQFD